MADKYPISFKITTSSKFNVEGNIKDWYPSYSAGQITFVEDTKKMYLDFHGKRTCYSGEGGGESYGVKFIGYVNDDPNNATTQSDGTITLADETTHRLSDQDMVAWGNKEYLWTMNKEGEFGWLLIGDDDAGSFWET